MTDPPPFEIPDLSPAALAEANSKKILAGVLGILLGAFGAHKFVLGLTGPAVGFLVTAIVCWVLTVFTLGFAILLTGPVFTALAIVGLVEGILYLTKSDPDFYFTYIEGKKPWF